MERWPHSALHLCRYKSWGWQVKFLSLHAHVCKIALRFEVKIDKQQQWLLVPSLLPLIRLTRLKMLRWHCKVNILSFLGIVCALPEVLCKNWKWLIELKEWFLTIYSIHFTIHLTGIRTHGIQVLSQQCASQAVSSFQAKHKIINYPFDDPEAISNYGQIGYG